MSDGENTWRFTYDASGMRTRRWDSNIYYEYVYNGSLLRQIVIDWWQTIGFTYDAGGIPLTITYYDEVYYYITNLQGDVVGIADSTGALVVRYSYDAWGKLLSITGSMADTLGTLNPLRYRGYVYDQETTLYYVCSRYYNPEIGRWISPEPNVYYGEFDGNAGLLGYNVYAYCANNPVMYKDETGEGIILACVITFGILGAALGGHVAAKASKSRLGYVNGWWVLGGVLAGGGTGCLIGWGVGAAATAIGAAMTAGSGGVLGSTIYANWQSAEQALRNLINSVSSQAARTFQTPWGNRIVDAYNSARRIIAEAKYGYQGLSQFIKTEIARDAWLLQNGIVKAVEWHFYVSKVTGKGGPSAPLLEALLEAGIKVIFH